LDPGKMMTPNFIWFLVEKLDNPKFSRNQTWYTRSCYRVLMLATDNGNRVWFFASQVQRLTMRIVGGSAFQPVDNFGKSEALHECANVAGHHFEPPVKRRPSASAVPSDGRRRVP
jgi:hypothetical protein